ncbi:glutamine synthetase [Bacillota bacterium LX-D]|nr:glutamine synthetase [Bacillota bacterium LX-D]
MNILDNVPYDNLLFYIPGSKYTKREIVQILKSHPEIKFVSMVGVDLGGNDTDEKIPIEYFFKHIDQFLGGGVQTDGSSVVLPGIATLNDGKVDLIPDSSVNWFVDYNYEFRDASNNYPVGTLRIPSFLMHNGIRVDSRSILENATEKFKQEIMSLLKNNSHLTKELQIDANDIEEIQLTSATELEFWVKTPDDKADIDELSASQVMQEQYWKRTKGQVRTALEKSLIFLDKYGLTAEMGHKEVGGVKAKIDSEGKHTHIMEQLEIDWKYAKALQAADNELLARAIVKETFQHYGLEVTFMAKPIEGVAGNGEHTHVGVTLNLKNGTTKNLFAPVNTNKDYLNVFGWGALMGILKNYEVINPFISSTNDSLNRLKPGFEAPICIVGSIGHDLKTPSRNRTVLVGLIRDLNNPLATRFEVRSPNPHTNTYLTLAAIYQAMLDGIKNAVESKKSSQELEADFSKPAGQDSFYLEKDRAYRSEEDVFEHYSEIERNKLFGVPPATVWENLENFSKYPEKKQVLLTNEVFNEDILRSYSLATRVRWITELKNRIIPENANLIRSFQQLHKNETNSDLDEVRWTKISELRNYLLKDTLQQKSLFTQLYEAIEAEDFGQVSRLQLEMADKMDEVKKLYHIYSCNILDMGSMHNFV